MPDSFFDEMQSKVTMPYLKDPDCYSEPLLEESDHRDRRCQGNRWSMKSYIFMLLGAASLTLAIHLLILMQWCPKAGDGHQPILSIQANPSIVYCNVSTLPAAHVCLLTSKRHFGTSSNIKSTLCPQMLGTTASTSELPRMNVILRGLAC